MVSFNTKIELESIDQYIEILNTKKKFFIDFYADWCAPCKSLSPINAEAMKEVNKTYKDIFMVYINIEKFPELADLYLIKTIPHVVLVSKNFDEVISENNLNDLHSNVDIIKVIHQYDEDEMSDALLDALKKGDNL